MPMILDHVRSLLLAPKTCLYRKRTRGINRWQGIRKSSTVFLDSTTAYTSRMGPGLHSPVLSEPTELPSLHYATVHHATTLSGVWAGEESPELPTRLLVLTQVGAAGTGRSAVQCPQNGSELCGLTPPRACRVLGIRK